MSSAQWIKLTQENGKPVWVRPSAFSEMVVVRYGAGEVTRLIINGHPGSLESYVGYTDVIEHPDAIIAKIHQ